MSYPVRSIIYYIVIFIFCYSHSAFAAVRAPKTPNDVFRQALILKQKMQQVRLARNIDSWPNVAAQKNKLPRHVLQKSLELLDKINRYRMIKKMGPIAIPSFPSRDITPNEVYEMMVRLVQEFDLVFDTDNTLIDPKPVMGKTPNDVYRVLWEISLSLNPVLGIRGFNPNDVYAQAKMTANIVAFLRRSQNLSSIPEPPPLNGNKHPNHALKAVSQLVEKISSAQHNLLIKPVKPIEVPRRVIVPRDVYDALQNVVAELNRVKFRLGLERKFEIPRVEKNKSPKDVIQKINWAAQMMPQFTFDRPLIQYDQKHLTKTPADVYGVSENILARLNSYIHLRGIPEKIKNPQFNRNLQPIHVFQKTLECLEKVNRLRMQSFMGSIAVPNYPLRPVTPTEVYELASRLSDEMDLIYQHTQSEIKDGTAHSNRRKKIVPGNVHFNMSRISAKLDLVLGNAGYTPTDVLKQSHAVLREVELIARYLNLPTDIKKVKLPKKKTPRDVIFKAREVMKSVRQLQDRAGMFHPKVYFDNEFTTVTPNETFNEVGVIRSELIALKIHIGMTDHIQPVNLNKRSYTPSHVYRTLEMINRKLKRMIP